VTPKNAPNTPPRQPARWLAHARRLGWRGLIASTIILAIGASGLMIWRASRGAQLLQADPDRIPANARLMAFGVSQGRGVFEAHCASCHGAARAVTQAADLSDQDYLYGQGLVSDNERVALYGIRAHNPRTWSLAEMPAYATPRPAASEPAIQPLKPGEIGDVVEYLRYLEARPYDATRLERGAQIYAGRGGCYDCHASDAQGDPAIGAPNLTDRIWLHGDGDRKAITNVIAHGARGACPSWVGRLSPLNIREVALYVYALSHPAAASARK
jgi:cytochrome c oxidase cbb3-type subunit 3